MIKRILLIAVLIVGMSAAAMAQSLYVGSGVVLAPSEPDFKQDSLLAPMVGYDFPQLWRISFMTTDSKNTTTHPETKMTESVIGVQRLFVYPMNQAFSLIGALGAGWYMVNLSGSGSGSGSGLGLMADGSLRWSFSKNLFADATFQFRDSGVQISSTGRDFTVDGGWTGVAAAIGWVF
jgi:hypothetical protein